MLLKEMQLLRCQESGEEASKLLLRLQAKKSDMAVLLDQSPAGVNN